MKTRMKEQPVSDLRPRTKRLIHLDVMRIISICLVMSNHTGTYGFFRFAVTENPVLQWIYLLISVASKVAIPLFLMASGAVLLGRTEPYRVVFRKRVLKFFLVLAASSIFYGHVYWYFHFPEGVNRASLAAVLETFYASNIYFHLWFLYAFIGLMLMLPLLRRLAQAMESKDYLYMAGMSVLFIGVLPILEYLFTRDRATYNRDMNVVLFSCTNIVYFLMGYYLEHKIPQKYQTRKTLAAGTAVSALMVLICSLMTMYRAKITGELNEAASQYYHNSLIAVPAYTCYLGAKMFFQRVQLPEKVCRAITTMSGTVFGVYLLDPILREKTNFVLFGLAPYTGTYIACGLWVLAAMVLGMFLVYWLKKIPGLKYLL